MTEEIKINTENTETKESSTGAPAHKEHSARQRVKDIFTAKNITRMAAFTAFAYLLYMPIFEFAPIPAVPFLKVDFSNAFVMMAGFSLGPISAIIVGVLKEVLHALTFSQTVGVGELANIIIMLPYVLIPSLVYKKRRNIKAVLITLAISSVAQAIWSIPVNYLLTFPFFMSVFGQTWLDGMNFYLTVWYWAVLFNLLKAVLISAVVLLLYKQFQRLFNLIFRDKKSTTLPVGVTAVRTAAQMEKLGKRVGESLVGGDVILLSGELGAGKTVFCKGVAKGLGVTATVSSPTFTLMNEYFGRVKFCHFDAYRLSDSDEAYGAGFTDFIGSADTVCAVEWWENVADMFDGCNIIKVEIVKTQSGREVKIER